MPRTPILKTNWRKFAKILKQYGVQYLYHFTDLRNVKSIIEQGGLYSWWSCKEKEILIPFPGGTRVSRNLDTRHGLQDFVRLNFNPNPPMLYAAEHLNRVAILEIEPYVVYWKDTKFSNENATAAAAKVGDDLDSFEAINFEIAVGTEWHGYDAKRWRQAEVMVKTHIPLSLMTITEFGWKKGLIDIPRIRLSDFAEYMRQHGD